MLIAQEIIVQSLSSWKEIGKCLAVNTVTNDHYIFIEKGEGSEKDENENIKTTNCTSNCPI